MSDEDAQIIFCLILQPDHVMILLRALTSTIEDLELRLKKVVGYNHLPSALQLTLQNST